MNALIFQVSGTPTNGTSSVWRLTIAGSPTGGIFTIRQNTYNPVTWSANNNVLLTNIRLALEECQTIGVGNVLVEAVSLTAGVGTIDITFINAKAKLAVDPLTVIRESFTGVATVAIAETTVGVTASQRDAPQYSLLSDISGGALYVNLSDTLFAPNWFSLGEGGGLAFVTTDATLTGDGTAFDPLSVVSGDGSAPIVREEPTGAVDGDNTIFTLLHTPVLSSESIFKNGILQNEGISNDYTISAGVITFTMAPLEGASIHVTYWVGSIPAEFVIRETPSGTIDGINDTFTIAFPQVPGSESLYRNGVLQDSGITKDYTSDQSTFTFNTPPLVGSALLISYTKL